MANIKFSQFTVGNTQSDIDFVVGYKGPDNVQISPTNLLASSLGNYLPLAGGTMTGDTLHGDNVKDIYGAGSDLQIYHDGSNSFIADSGTGKLKVTASQFDIINAANTEFMAEFIENAEVKLYHNNSKKFETTSYGIDVTGRIALNDGNNNVCVGDDAGLSISTGIENTFIGGGAGDSVTTKRR